MLLRIVALEKKRQPLHPEGIGARFERAANPICGACPYWKNPHD
jgi:hypothetical protein